MPADVSTQDSRRYVMLGRYRVLEHIATGGMAAVYRAFDPVAERAVALKVLLPELLAGKPALVERFRREAQHGARLRHENIVRLYEFVEAGGTCFLVMELVEGTNLQEHILEHGPLEPAEARQVLLQMARALDHAHRQGIVHRDIKPGNILLTHKDGQTIAKLSDLGLARESRDGEFRLTREGYTVGTVDYMAPEQARDSAAADIRSDIYSLGCTFFHMLTGQPPFNEGTLPERIYKHAEVEAPDVRTFNPAVPADLAAVLRRMLGKKPEDRYQTPAGLLADLAGAEWRVGRGGKPSKRRRTTPAAGPVTPLPVPASGQPPAAPRYPPPADVTAGQVAWARKQIAGGNPESALGLLLARCRLDPGNLSCHKALREALDAQRAGRRGRGWLRWLRGQLARLRLRLARRSGSHLQVLAQGAEVLALLPDDLSTQLDMAAAADALGLDELSLWLLETARQERTQSAPINRALGRHYEKQQDYDQALAHWELVARACPTDGEAPRKVRDLAALQALARNRQKRS
jgi:hypothetical protein